MILADTSVWIDHFRTPGSVLPELVERQMLVMHPLIIGEIAMGGLPRRSGTIGWLERLKPAPEARHREVRQLVEDRRLFGIGIGFIDAHLLASALLEAGLRIWTRDVRFAAAADRLGVGGPGPASP